MAYPNLTAANQLLFHLGNRQRFFSARLYTFSIPSVAKAPYIVKITQFPEQVTRQLPQEATYAHSLSSAEKAPPGGCGKDSHMYVIMEEHEETLILSPDQSITSSSRIY